MLALVSETAFDRFGNLLPDRSMEWIRHTAGGELIAPTGPVGSDEAEPELAWATPDVLYDGSADSFFSVLRRADSLRWLQSSFAGLDVPVYRDLLTRGCRVTRSHENSVSIAEYVLSSVLRCYQRPQDWELAQSEREWRHHEFREVLGSRWLVVGMGAIGSATAVRARAFGAHVTGVRRSPTGREPVDRMIAPRQLVDEVGAADVVVLALPGTPETDDLVDDTLLAHLRPDAVLVNVARGSLIDDAALLRALDARPDARAVLDAFREEPLPPEHPFWTHPQVTVTPHASSGGLGRHRRNAELFVRNLDAFRSGAPLENEVTLDDLPAPRPSSVPAQFQTAADRDPGGAPARPAVLPQEAEDLIRKMKDHSITPLSDLGSGVQRNRHTRLAVFILGLAAAIGGAAVGLLWLVNGDSLEPAQYYSVACLGVLLAWWITYFNFQRLGIVNLRAFLRDKNPYRADGKSVEHVDIQVDEDTNVVTKAAFSVGAQGILIAIIALFLDLVLSTGDLDTFRDILRPVIVFMALLTILTMVLAIDILDTAANVYASGKWTPFQYRQWFNAGVGPSFPKGGASYAYYGFALFSAYIVLGLMFFYPLMSGYGVAIYTYLGYPFLFGYQRVVNDRKEVAVEVDEKAGVGSKILGGTLLVATAAVGIVS